jgi:hypothetical protein
MESSGRMDCVQMSAASYAASKLPTDTLHMRVVDIKGKGPMETYLIDATAPEAAYIRSLLDVSTAAHPRKSNPCMTLELPLDKAPEPELTGGDAEPLVAAGTTDSSSSAATKRAAEGEHTHEASSSSSGSRLLAAAAAASAEANTRLREAAATHFVLQTSVAMSPSIFYIIFGWSRRQRFLLASNASLVLSLAGIAAFAGRALMPSARRAALLPWWPALFVSLHAMLVSCITLVLIDDFVQTEQPARGAAGAVRAYFWAIQLALTPLNWLIAQLPLRIAFFPECIRNATYVAAALHIAHEDGALTARFAAGAVAEGVACTALVCMAVELCFCPSPAVLRQLEDVDMCPALLHGVRGTLQHVSKSMRRRLFDQAFLLDVSSVIFLGFYSCACAYNIFIATPAWSLPQAASSLTRVLSIKLLSAACSKLRPTSERALEALEIQMSMASHAHAFTLLREHLAAASSEAAILRVACNALADLFPGAGACALGAFAEGSAQDVIASLECIGDERSRRALADALPVQIGAPLTGSAVSSVALACRTLHGRSAAVIDSRELAGGIMHCSDWSAAVSAGLHSVQAITAPLNAGSMVVGFVQLHFSVYAASERAPTSTELAILRELADVVGGAVFVRRALAIGRDAFNTGMRAAGVPTRKPSSEVAPLCRTESGDGEAAYPANEEDAVALAALDARAAQDKAALLDWHLDAWMLPDGEVLHLITAMLHSHGLLRRFRISPAACAAFAAGVQARMHDVPFHNFRHAFMVMHTSWLFLADSGLRKGLLQDVDWLALLLASICHDLDHPGTTNAFQVNTASELALRYNDASVLEHHHAATAFELMNGTKLLANMDREEYKALRKLVVSAILATDST